MKLHKIIHSDLVKQIYNITDTFIRHVGVTRFCAQGLRGRQNNANQYFTSD